MMAAGPNAAPPPQYYLLRNYFLRNSTQLPRLHEFMSRGFLPAAARLHAGPAILLEALVASHMPQYAAVLPLASLEQWETLRQGLLRDADYQRAFAAWENGPEPPFEHYSETLLRAASYSPEIAAAREAKPRVFELRQYHSPTWRQLAALHQRFAGPEIRIFHRCGIHPLFYSETALGPHMPNLTYLIPFEDLAAREKAWNAFGADPEWLRVRQQSIEADGQISSVIQISLFKAAPYSPIG